MKKSAALLFFLSPFIFPLLSCAAVPFYDEFDDGDFADGAPVTWRLPPDVGAMGTRELEDETFVISGSGFTTQWVNDVPNSTDISLRASVRVESGLWGFGVRAVPGSLYWAGIRSSGGIFVGHTKNFNNTFGGQMRTDSRPADEFVSLQMDLRDMEDGVEVSLFSWEDGEKIPNEPQLRYVDRRNTLTNGSIGMFINEGSPGTTYVDYYQTFHKLGDVNGNGTLDAGDIDQLSASVRAQKPDLAHDVDGDRRVDNDDRSMWINDLYKTYLGDSNLDGEFNSQDFVSILQVGEYEDEIALNSTWETGDWNGDAEFDTSDFVSAFQAGGYELGPRNGLISVPEPTGFSLWLIAIMAIGTWRKATPTS